MKSIRIHPRALKYRHLAAGIMAILVVFAGMPIAFAAEYPEKPIRWVVPSTPGGATDTTTRIIAHKFGEFLGQPLVIENRPGASGNIGAEYVARVKPDGYTLLTCIASNAGNAALNKNIPFDLSRDFTPISMLVIVPEMIVSHPSVPAKNLKELIALMKAKPDQLKYSSAGVGSIQHLAMELFLHMTGTKMLHVPYKSQAPAITDALSGYVPLTCLTSLSAMPHVRAGRLRAYGVSSTSRMEIAPDIPTIAEQGVPGYEAVQWFGLLGPAGMPREIVTKLHAAMVRTLQDPEVRKRFLDQGAEPKASGSPEEFGTLIRSELAKWAKVVKDSGIKSE